MKVDALCAYWALPTCGTSTNTLRPCNVTVCEPFNFRAWPPPAARPFEVAAVCGRVAFSPADSVILRGAMLRLVIVAVLTRMCYSAFTTRIKASESLRRAVAPLAPSSLHTSTQEDLADGRLLQIRRRTDPSTSRNLRSSTTAYSTSGLHAAAGPSASTRRRLQGFELGVSIQGCTSTVPGFAPPPPANAPMAYDWNVTSCGDWFVGPDVNSYQACFLACS